MRRIAQLTVAAVALGMCGGCSRPPQPPPPSPPATIIELSVTVAGRGRLPVRGARLKALPAEPLLHSLVALAAHTSLADGIPDSVHATVFGSLPVVAGELTGVTDSSGLCVLPPLDAALFVVAYAPPNAAPAGAGGLWIVSAADQRDGRLVLDDANRGGPIALQTILRSPDRLAQYRDRVAGAVEELLEHKQFDRARALVANSAGCDSSAWCAQWHARIDQEQSAHLASLQPPLAARPAPAPPPPPARPTEKPAPQPDATLAQRQREREGGKLRAFLGHDGTVTSVAFSPDGQFILSGGHDQTVRLWELDSGRATRVLRGHEAWVNCVAFSPDGALAASGSDDQTVKLWDTAGGSLLHSFSHGWMVAAVAFSPDGRLLASGSGDKTIKLWDPTSGRLLRALDHGAPVSSLAFHPRDRLLLSGSSNGSLKLWPLDDGTTPLQTWQMPGRSPLTSVAFSPDGRLALGASDDKTLALWETDSGRLLRSILAHDGWVTGVAFSPNGRFIFSGSTDRTVKLWETDTGRLVFRFVHDGPVTSVCYAPNGWFLLSGSDTATVTLIHTPSQTWSGPPPHTP